MNWGKLKTETRRQEHTVTLTPLTGDAIVRSGLSDEQLKVFLPDYGRDAKSICEGMFFSFDEVQRNGRRDAQNLRRFAAVPRTLQRLLQSTACKHPGLLLDKYAEFGASQTHYKLSLQAIVEAYAEASAMHEYAALHSRWLKTQERLDAQLLTATTSTPLALHLSRANHFENASVSLHPIYGFVYLPASGTKGMCRSFAETVWFANRYERKADSIEPLNDGECAKAAEAWLAIERVFGWVPGSNDRKEGWLPACVKQRVEKDPRRAGESAGSVVFHDAWPVCWNGNGEDGSPSLQVDILNNHHPDYYDPSKTNAWPGDWENPNPVYFLSVRRGARFTFPLSKRRCNDLADCDLARNWLNGSLTRKGTGARTGIGFGYFSEDAVWGDATELTVGSRHLQPKLLVTLARDEEFIQFKEGMEVTVAGCSVENLGQDIAFKAEVTMVTPAFVGGADQSSGSELLGKSLKSAMRWWWRTIHSAHLSLNQLQWLEELVFGGLKRGNRLAVVVTPSGLGNKTETFTRSEAELAPRGRDWRLLGHRIRQDNSTQPVYATQGLHYGSYGMGDESSSGWRDFCYPGTTWTIRIIAPPSREISTTWIMNEAITSLLLLCQFGGVGGKARRGFGSLSLPHDMSSTDVVSNAIENGAAFRALVGTALPRATDEGRAQSPHLEQLLAVKRQPDSSATNESQKSFDPDRVLEMPVVWRNCWNAIDHVNDAYRHAMHQLRHCELKAAVGLPRQIHGPKERPFGHQEHPGHAFVGGPVSLHRQLGLERLASSLHMHLTQSPDCRLQLRVVTFPYSVVPSGDGLANDIATWGPKVLAAILRGGSVSYSGRTYVLQGMKAKLSELCREFASEGQEVVTPPLTLLRGRVMTAEVMAIDHGWHFVRLNGYPQVGQGSFQLSPARSKELALRPGTIVSCRIDSINEDGTDLKVTFVEK